MVLPSPEILKEVKEDTDYFEVRVQKIKIKTRVKEETDINRIGLLLNVKDVLID